MASQVWRETWLSRMKPGEKWFITRVFITLDKFWIPNGSFKPVESVWLFWKDFKWILSKHKDLGVTETKYRLLCVTTESTAVFSSETTCDKFIESEFQKRTTKNISTRNQNPPWSDPPNSGTHSEEPTADLCPCPNSSHLPRERLRRKWGNGVPGSPLGPTSTVLT